MTDAFYTFKHAERKGKSNEPWVIRQTGVYQKFDFEKGSSLFIVFNVVPNSLAHRRVLDCLMNHQKQVQASPLWLHEIIHASYFMSWRDYIAEYESRLLPIVSN